MLVDRGGPPPPFVPRQYTVVPDHVVAQEETVASVRAAFVSSGKCVATRGDGGGDDGGGDDGGGGAGGAGGAGADGAGGAATGVDDADSGTISMHDVQIFLRWSQPALAV